MRDLRDPRDVGEKLLHYREQWPAEKLSRLADLIRLGARNYDKNPSCIEKYGRPQELPVG